MPGILRQLFDEDPEWQRACRAEFYVLDSCEEPEKYAPEDIDVDDIVNSLMQMEASLKHTSKQLGRTAERALKDMGNGVVTVDDVLPIMEVRFILDTTSASPTTYGICTRTFPKDYEGQFAVIHTDKYVVSKFGDVSDGRFEFWMVHPNKLLVDKIVAGLTEEHTKLTHEFNDPHQSSRFFTGGILSVTPAKEVDAEERQVSLNRYTEQMKELMERFNFNGR